MPPSGCPGEGSELGTLPPLSPPDCFSSARNLPSQWSWLLGFQFWPQVAGRGNPKVSALKVRASLEHQKRKQCWGSLRKRM